MAEGIVCTLAVDKGSGRSKGFGFIEPTGGGKQVFMHRSALQNCEWEEIREGSAVTFDLESGPKGPRAERVYLKGV